MFEHVSTRRGYFLLIHIFLCIVNQLDKITNTKIIHATYPYPKNEQIGASKIEWHPWFAFLVKKATINSNSKCENEVGVKYLFASFARAQTMTFRYNTQTPLPSEINLMPKPKPISNINTIPHLNQPTPKAI